MSFLPKYETFRIFKFRELGQKTLLSMLNFPRIDDFLKILIGSFLQNFGIDFQTMIDDTMILKMIARE